MYRKAGLPWTKHWDFILLDLFSMIVSVAIAYYIRRPQMEGLLGTAEYRTLLFSLVAVDFLALVMFNPLKGVLRRGYLIESYYTLRNVAVVFAAESLFFFSIQMGDYYSRLTIGYTAVIFAVFSYGVRVLYKWYYKKYVIPRDGSSLLIIAEPAGLADLAEKIREHYYDSFRLAGLVLSEKTGSDCPPPLPEVAEIEGVTDWVRQNWVDEVMLLLPPNQRTWALAEAFMSMGITVHFGISHIREKLPRGKQELESVGGYDVITVFWNSANFAGAAAKRACDLVGGLLGCLITAVLMLFIGPAIYLASPGPIFYKQERIGRNGKVFKMYKFRSMYLDADARKKEFMAQNRVANGLMFKLDWDPRIIGNKELPDGTRKTGIGEFIRKTSLDEFPQFLNVLKGDMSLVGTRPPTKDEWMLYEDHHRARMAMRPGITGMWQVSGRSNITDFEEIVRLDTRYIDEWSLLLDLKILIKTFLVVLKHEGSM